MSYYKAISMHERAIDWAIAQGYYLSVTDISCEPDEWDVWLSQDRKEVIDACEATELPNVSIYRKRPSGKYARIAVFSVIDEGTPEETINDYSAKQGGEFDTWFEGCAA